MKFRITLIKAPQEQPASFGPDNYPVDPRMIAGSRIEIDGLERPDGSISHADSAKVIEVEQWLEHMLGIRVHISQLS